MESEHHRQQRKRRQRIEQRSRAAVAVASMATTAVDRAAPFRVRKTADSATLNTEEIVASAGAGERQRGSCEQPIQVAKETADSVASTSAL